MRPDGEARFQPRPGMAAHPRPEGQSLNVRPMVIIRPGLNLAELRLKDRLPLTVQGLVDLFLHLSDASVDHLKFPGQHLDPAPQIRQFFFQSGV
jgi:hypothetical protein